MAVASSSPAGIPGDGAESVATESSKPASLRQRLRLPLMLVAPIVVVLGGIYFYLTGGRYESTDDAYVRAAQTSISSNISGRVIAVKVHDNQWVHRGEVLFRLDDADFRVALQAAKAELASARLQIDALKATARQRQTELQSAQDTLNYQRREYARQQRLLKLNIASQAQFDQAQHVLDDAQQKVAGAQQQLAAALADLGGNVHIPVEQHPTVLQAQSVLDRARLNLSYTVITAPSDGVVTKVEQLQVGNYINAATPVFALISTRDVWIEANFKEVQLTHMRVGQTATVHIDTYPGKTFTAKVASLSPGTGSQFSVLPPENATGNWVKVVQRLPVRLEVEGMDPAFPLQAGLSATVTVDTEYRRHWFGGAEPGRTETAVRQ